jgi:hypothetical protein
MVLLVYYFYSTKLKMAGHSVYSYSFWMNLAVEEKSGKQYVNVWSLIVNRSS